MGPPNRNRNQKKQKPKNTKATAKRLFSYLEQEKHKIAAAFVCVLVSSASTLCGSYLLRPIINGLIDSTKTPQQKITSLMAGLALMAVVYVLGVGATYLQGRIMISVSQGTLKRIREHLFRKVQKLPVRYFDTNPTGDIMSRFFFWSDPGPFVNDVISEIKVLGYDNFNRYTCTYALHKLGACGCDDCSITDYCKNRNCHSR